MAEALKNSFEEAAQQESQGGLLCEFWDFLKHNKKWWLLPIVALFLVFALLMWLTTTAAAPFIYTLF